MSAVSQEVSRISIGICMQALPGMAGCKPVTDRDLNALMAAAFPNGGFIKHVNGVVDIGMWEFVAACICPQKLQEHANLVLSLFQGHARVS